MEAARRSIGPGAGGAVMATGILSVAIHSAGSQTLSLVLLAVTAIAWALLGALFLWRLWAEPARWRAEAGQPASLTAVAGTAVLGGRLTLLGWSWAGWALLVIASILWLLLSCLLASARPLPRTGGAFLVVVAPQSLAVLGAELADRSALGWLTIGALVPFILGLGAYVVVLARFDFGELRTGGGDQWVSGGALAISTLACGDLARASTAASITGAVHQPLRVGSLVLWALTMAWLPALIAAEARWPRPRYDARRWATVFPLGMYSVMSFTVGTVAGSAGIADFGRVWAWVAAAAWATTTIGLLGHVAHLTRGSSDG